MSRLGKHGSGETKDEGIHEGGIKTMTQRGDRKKGGETKGFDIETKQK